MLTYGSVCSGIEAVSVAWRGLMRPLWFSEIEPFPCAVLAYHYPDIPNLGDMTALPQKIINREIPAPDVLVGGTPCQAFSVAGLRNSLDDERGNLTLTLIHILEAIDYVRFIDGKQPCVLLWENVPGVLSTKDNAFGHFLAGLAQEREPLQPAGARWANSGYVHSARTIAWRILDAQYFGLAQRRKRVFVVASARQRSVAQILIERKSLCRDIETSETARESITAYTEGSFGMYRQSVFGGVVKASGGALGGGSETIVVLNDQGGQSLHVEQHCISPTLRSEAHGNLPVIMTPYIIRKLTPVECERLMGFPGNYTCIPWHNKSTQDCPDSPRYKAIGNSMATPVIKWIGERIINYIGDDTK